MTHAGYVIAGWGISLAAIGGYTWHLLRRARTLARDVPPERRRWIDS
jgi:hypothetical protein